MDTQTIEPGSTEWHRQRAGYLTGSRAESILRRSQALVRELITIRESVARGTYTAANLDTPALAWGRKNESAAIAHYELEHWIDVDPSRFCVDPQREYWRGTPDGFIGEDGLIEVKCPYNGNNHLTTIHAQKAPFNHVCQMQAYLAITGRSWCDYLSFDPRQTPELQLFTYRYESDPDLQGRLLTAVDDVWHLVTNQITSRGTGIPELF